MPSRPQQDRLLRSDRVAQFWLGGKGAIMTSLGVDERDTLTPIMGLLPRESFSPNFPYWRNEENCPVVGRVSVIRESNPSFYCFDRVVVVMVAGFDSVSYDCNLISVFHAHRHDCFLSGANSRIISLSLL